MTASKRFGKNEDVDDKKVSIEREIVFFYLFRNRELQEKSKYFQMIFHCLGNWKVSRQ